LGGREEEEGRVWRPQCSPCAPPPKPRAEVKVLPGYSRVQVGRTHEGEGEQGTRGGQGFA